MSCYGGAHVDLTPARGPRAHDGCRARQRPARPPAPGRRVLDVYRGTWVDANIGIAAGRVATLDERELEAADVIDASGQWIVPGFFEPHFHCGGSHLALAYLAHAFSAGPPRPCATSRSTTAMAGCRRPDGRSTGRKKPGCASSSWRRSSSSSRAASPGSTSPPATCWRCSTGLRPWQSTSHPRRHSSAEIRRRSRSSARRSRAD